jgi:hypothetical protein
LFDADAIAGHPRGKALRDLFNRRGLSFGRHGFLLGYEKTSPDSGRKKPPQKALAFFFGSARVGIATSLLLQFQFLEGPLPGGFSLFRS